MLRTLVVAGSLATQGVSMSRRSAFVRGPGGVTRRASAKKGRRALLRRESLTAPEVDEAVDDDDSEKYRKTVGVSLENQMTRIVSQVLLPSTEFSQRANAVKKEPELQKWWDEQRVYERIWERATGPTFTLHDGPPYANGDLHIGHALNKVLKDFINRYRMLRGNKVRYVPGWDCHGLPIELKVVQGLQAEEKKKKKKKKKEKDEGGSPPPPSKALDPLELREKAASFALETVEKQKAAFKRYGVWADWDRPYLTLAPEYEAAQLRVFANMFERGHIYRGRKPVWYSPSSRTALAEAELEYPDGHTSPSVYASFDVVEAAPCAAEYAKNLKLAIWTTTPWTLPANLAVAVGGELEYAVVERTEREERLVVASELVETLSAKFGEELRRLATFTGEELSRGTTYARPVKNEGGEVGRVVVGGDYITAEGGTGLVHTAPGHGLDDFVTGNKYGLDAFSPVDAAGAFTSEAGEGLAGLSVLGEGGKEVASRLEASGHVLLAEPYAHRYPYDWRTKKPVIMRATDQWFASVESFKEAALAAIDEVAWTPSVGKNRISAMTSGRGDWCISRQRAWGVPIPVFYRKSNGEALVTSETIARVEAIVKEKGTDAWWSLEVGELLPPSMRDVADQYIKGTDTMDVWFDSGTSWAGVVASRDELGALPADLYLEGSDQHRGWFQSSLLTSVAVNGGKAPYKAVLTHGFVLDEKGFKMSKSSGNVVDPREVIEGGKDKKAQPPYGADVLRLWVAGVDYAADVRVGANALKQVFEQYRKLRNTFRYLVGNVFDLDEKPDLAYDALPSLDKWILGRLGALEIEAFEAYESYNFARVVNAATRFCVVDLSALYLDVSKDRLYVSPANAKRRRDCQATIAACLSALPRILGPLLPHLAEDLWQAIPYLDGEPLSPDRASVFDLDAPWDIENDDSRLAPFPPHDEARWDVIRALRDDANKALEAARRDGLLGASLDARLFVAPPSENDDRQRAFHAAIAPFLQNAPFQPHSAGWSDVDDLRFLLLVSGVDIVETLEGTPCDPAHVVPSDLSETGATVGVAPATTPRCARCWYHDASVGASEAHPTLCARCDDAVRNLPDDDDDS